MNFDLRDVGITLAIGAFVLYGGELLFWVCFRTNLYRTLRDAAIISERGSVALSLALSLGLGLLLQGVSKKMLRGKKVGSRWNTSSVKNSSLITGNPHG